MRSLTCAVLCLTCTVAAGAAVPKKKAKAPVHPAPPKLHFDQAYFNGHLVTLHSPPLEKGERVLVVGPWNFGPKVSPKPNDMRPNLYFVAPGTQHQVEGHPEYDHNEILSLAPEDVREFDVYWALVLDPTLTDDFSSEPQLIVATQATFEPGEDFTFDKIPSAGFLRYILKITDLNGLDKYRRPDGSLPRMAIITAGFAVRFSVENPEKKQADAPASDQ